jgi:hypothetical protein
VAAQPSDPQVAGVALGGLHWGPASPADNRSGLDHDYVYGIGCEGPQRDVGRVG